MQPVNSKATVTNDIRASDIEMAKPFTDSEIEMAKPENDFEPTAVGMVRLENDSDLETAKPENFSEPVRKLGECSTESDSTPKKKRKYQKRTSIEPSIEAIVTCSRRSGRAVQKTEIFTVHLHVKQSKKDAKAQTPKVVKSDPIKTDKIVDNKDSTTNNTAINPTECAAALAENEREMRSDPEYMDIDPAADATRTIVPALLLPFKFGWTREISFRQVKSGSSTSDVYYGPPPDTENGTKRRKRRSKLDVERYFEENPSKYLTKDNFVFNKIMGLNNEEYECVRYAKSMPQYANAVSSSSDNKPVRQSLVPSFHSDVRKVELVGDYDDEMPISLQIAMGVPQLRQEHEKRRQKPDRSTCRTPPLAGDMPWTYLDDDPLGVFTQLGGRSDPATPPPLRAVKVTSHSTVKEVESRHKAIRANLPNPYEYAASKAKDDLEQKEHLASHDASIKKSTEEDTTPTELALIGDENRTI